MTPFLQMLLWTTAAGVCMPIGAALARIERIRPQWLEDEFRHTLIAIGGGLLLGAVALVLVPEGVGRITSPVAAAALLLAGGVAYMAFDRAQAKQQRSTPQFAAMASDLVPECLALGGMFAANAEGAVLLAVLIGLQSLPEAFNAWRELATDDLSVRTAFAMMAAMALLAPLFGLAGWYWLADQHFILGSVMLLAAGGILHLTIQDIAPQARLERHWAPPLGAVLGFALALLAEMAI